CTTPRSGTKSPGKSIARSTRSYSRRWHCASSTCRTGSGRTDRRVPRRPRWRRGGCPLGLPALVAPVSLPGRHRGLRRLAHILRQRPAHIVAFLDAPVLVATDIALVAVGRDQFALGCRRRRPAALACTAA